MDCRLLGERIRQRRTELDMTQGDIASQIGVAISTVQRYEKGQIEKIKLPVVEAVARTLRVDPDWLVGKTDSMVRDNPTLPSNITPIDLAHLKRIPILGHIAAGMPIYAEENIEGYTYTDLNGGAEYFGLRVRGDSMDTARIHDGDIVIIRRQDIVENGEIAAVLIDGEDATLKRFTRTGDTVTLMPQSTNPANQPFIYNLKETSVKILGLVVKVEFQPR